MHQRRPTFWDITGKAIIVHSVTYFLVGLFAFIAYDYAARFADPAMRGFLRQTDHPLVAAGPLFQPIRGFLFGVVFYLLREILFRGRDGWLRTWIMLVFVGIFSTFGPAPGSIEGLIYTTLPVRGQLLGLSEVLLQSLLLAILTNVWVRSDNPRWINWVMGILFATTLLLPALGLLAAQLAF
jgi:hypothetical protein